MSGVENYNSDDESKALMRLRQSSPLATDSGFIGYTRDGSPIWFPRSFLAGYWSVINGNNLTIVNDFLGLGLAGQLSDGTTAYLPSFREGIQIARNEFRFAVLAEAQRRTFKQLDNINQEHAELLKRVDELEKELKRKDDGKKDSK